MPRAARPWIGKVSGGFHRATHAARAGTPKLFARDATRGHDASARGFGEDSDRIMKVRRGAKTAMPPRIVKRVGQNSFKASGGYVSRHLVADQTNLSQE